MINLAVRANSLDRNLIEAGYQNVVVEQVPVPHVGNGEVLVRITLRPIHPYDLLLAMRGLENALPLTMGAEAVGVVEQSGKGANKFSVGQRVIAAGWDEQLAGAWQDLVSISETRLMAVPACVDDKTAAQAFVTPVTVVGLLDVAEVPEGRYVLQSAANGVLGRALIQYAAHVGTQTINIVRRPGHIQELRDLGADEVIDSSSEDVVQRVLEITGGAGAWASVDCLAGQYTNVLMRATRRGGTCFLFDGLSHEDVSLKVRDVLMGGRHLHGFLLEDWLHADGPAVAERRLAYTMKLLKQKVITPLSDTVSRTLMSPVGVVFPMEQVHAAIAASLKPGRGGKVFLSSSNADSADLWRNGLLASDSTASISSGSVNDDNGAISNGTDTAGAGLVPAAAVAHGIAAAQEAESGS